MGMVLIVIGLGWAILGVFNLFAGLSKLQEAGYGETAMGFALMFNMFVLILQGLGLAGIGKVVRRRSATRVEAAANVEKDTIACPFCAETIKAAAKICRYCQKALA